jgi:hypothetical protein
VVHSVGSWCSRDTVWWREARRRGRGGRLARWGGRTGGTGQGGLGWAGQLGWPDEAGLLGQLGHKEFCLGGNLEKGKIFPILFGLYSNRFDSNSNDF